jgi:hypothetical protein
MSEVFNLPLLRLNVSDATASSLTAKREQPERQAACRVWCSNDYLAWAGIPR